MYTSMLWAALTPLLWVSPFLILISLFKAPHVKGWFGELRVSWVTRYRLNPSTYHLLDNLTLPNGIGTTQIDHVLVSPYGVFVIETKNYSGWIFGSASQRQWTQQIYRYKSRFQNPLHQNYKHLKTLETVLGLRSEQLHGIVVMVGSADFRTPIPAGVTYLRGYLDFIKSKKTVVLSEPEVIALVAQLEKIRLKPSLSTTRAHVKNLHERHAIKFISSQKTGIRPVRKADERPVCPKCAQLMVLRKAKCGVQQNKNFWGCSSYPTCKGIRPLAPTF